MPRRLTALLIGILALAALRGVFDGLPVEAPVAQKIAAMTGLFAACSALAAAGLIFAEARAHRLGGVWVTGLALAMAVVLLASLGLSAAGWAVQGLYRGVPLAVLVWAVVFARGELRLAHLRPALAWPAGFAALVLLRGYGLGDWPLPGLAQGDLAGLIRLAAEVVLYLLAFVLEGLRL